MGPRTSQDVIPLLRISPLRFLHFYLWPVVRPSSHAANPPPVEGPTPVGIVKTIIRQIPQRRIRTSYFHQARPEGEGAGDIVAGINGGLDASFEARKYRFPVDFLGEASFPFPRKFSCQFYGRSGEIITRIPDDLGSNTCAGCIEMKCLVLLWDLTQIVVLQITIFCNLIAYFVRDPQLQTNVQLSRLVLGLNHYGFVEQGTYVCGFLESSKNPVIGEVVGKTVYYLFLFSQF